MKEGRRLEFKERVTSSFLKTISAFANYDGGEIIFGIDDNGIVVGLDNYDTARLDIENTINDTISPRPDYYFVADDRKRILKLVVNKGVHKPYYYKGKAYKRNDTSTIEMERVELNRVILEGSGQYYDELITKEEILSFDILEKKLISTVGISKLSKDILKTLNLYKKGDYTVAAALLADNNSYPGVDLVRFGNNINIILDRETFEHMSILEQYRRSVDVYKRYYQKEVIEGFERKCKHAIPEDAFREAIANALIHRTWDVASHIRIAMYNDRIEIMSPGGLPLDISKEEYLKGQVSSLRNPTIASVFFRLGYIEMFGTGIARIIALYNDYGVKPRFEIYDNSIKVVLPCVDIKPILTSDEKIIYALIEDNTVMTSRDLVENSGFNKSKVLRLIKNLVDKEYVQVSGVGRNTKYHL